MNKIKRITSSSLLQHDSSDCGVACLASIINYYGGEISLEKLRNLSGTSKTGTSMLGLYQAALICGMSAVGYEATLLDIRNHPDVLILHVIIKETLEHYIVCYGFEDDKYLIWDPARGLIRMTEIDLEKIWKSNKCLSLSPNGQFVYKSEQTNEKRKWIFEMIMPDKDLLFISAVLGILISALGLIMALYTQKLIDNILPSGEVRVLVFTSAIVLLLLLSRILILSIRQMFLLKQGKALNIRIVNDFFNSLLYLPKAFFDTRKTGDFVARLNDTMRIQRVVADITSIYIIDILVIIIIMIVLFYYSQVAGIVSIICLPLFYFLIRNWNKRIINSQQDVMAGYAANESNFIDSITGITEIKSMNWQNLFSRKSNVIYGEFQDKILNLGKIKVSLNLITGIAGSFYIIIILVISASQVMRSSMTQGELMAIISLSTSLLPSALNIALISIPISEAKVAINRMFEFTKIESEFQNEKNHIPLVVENLILKDISFRFPGQSMLLEKINISIEKGKVISLIGESGCGKSTLASIVMRFYSPESGKILINDDHDAFEFQISDWRSKIAIIPQDIHIFNGTILQNLIEEVDKDRISEMISIISELGLASFIESFPNGLMTLVGEAGINLSGGQKQMLAFLRVIITKPDILIIDEGTSNMDRSTEVLIMKLINKIKSRMGILLISHKINMIKKLSDFIYVIEGKTISARGSHDAIINGNNIYKKFWEDYN